MTKEEGAFAIARTPADASGLTTAWQEAASVSLGQQQAGSAPCRRPNFMAGMFSVKQSRH